jgi:hypothetical protein
MGCLASGGNDNLNASVFRIDSEIMSPIRGPVGRNYPDLVWQFEISKHPGSFLHYLIIGFAAHNHGNKGF